MAQVMEERADIRNVRSLRPLRVLVAARDARFGRVAGFLLARRGFDVEILHRPSKVLDAVSRTGVDVVIVDASDSVSEAARTVAALEALHPHLTVVVVADDPADADGATLRVLPKWTSLETLVLNLEATHLGAGTF
jgi:PleD family two-component response regulator